MARPQGFEPWASEVITLGTLTGLSYRRVGGPSCSEHDLPLLDALSLELMARCSSVKRITGQVSLQQFAVHRSDSKGHRLPCVRRIALDDKVVRQPRRRQPVGQRPKLGFGLNGKGHRIGPSRQVTGGGLSCGVDQLCSLNAERNVGTDDAVVRQVGVVNVRSSCCQI